MRPQDVMKLAHFTRRFGRYRNPLAYRLSRRLLKLVMPKQSHEPFRTVATYDRGYIHVDTGRLHEYEILFHHEYEPAITGLIKRIVRDGDVCLDIGANIGSLTLIMAHAAGSTGRVVAVEPNPHIVQRLKANIDLNRLVNCTVIQAAVSDTPGKATLHVAREEAFHQGKSSLKPVAGLQEEVVVETIQGGDLARVAGSGRCTFIKIDAEGHDFIVLKELTSIVETHRPHLVFEYDRQSWQNHGSEGRDALTFLGRLDYRVYYIKNDIIFPLAGDLPGNCDLLGVPVMP
ncbi:MAG TPA: FkbM family methyltransferase [Desulfomonilia bacterium]|nr:FkbM family methyltransferase [Desulfomonilia bacterium]